MTDKQYTTLLSLVRRMEGAAYRCGVQDGAGEYQEEDANTYLDSQVELNRFLRTLKPQD